MSSTTGGGGRKGKSAAKRTTSSAIGKGIRKWQTTSNPDFSDNSDDYSSSDPSSPVARPDKETVLADCNKMKKKFELQSKKKLESLAAFLIGKGAHAGRTCQETFHEALVDLIEGNDDVAKVFSQKIGQYVAMRFYNTGKTILPLESFQEWDKRVVEFVIELIEDLKDIELTVPQLQAISALGDCYGRAPQGGAEALIADSIKQHVKQWLDDSMSEYEMMRVWAKSPTWIIRTGQHNRFCPW